MAEVRKEHKSLAVCWLILVFPADPASSLLTPVITNEWETPPVPLEIGVYQGDPLSVVIFNTVINTLVVTLQSRIDLGYTLSSSTRQINLLQCADNTFLLADSTAACLLEIVELWLQWSEMRVEVYKCHCRALQGGSTWKLIDPQFWLVGETIPFTTNNSIEFWE